MQWKAPGKSKQNFGIIQLSLNPLSELKGQTLVSYPIQFPKKPKPTPGRGTILEEWLNGPCKIHNTPDTTPTHSLRACWILRQVAKSGEDLLIKHPVGDNSTVFTVFKTFASNNRCKRALCGLAEVCRVTAINPWNDMAITFNASDKPQFRTA